MKLNGITENYEQNYRYVAQADVNPADIVNKLYDPVMRNDKQALEEVLKILGNHTYYLVYKRLSAQGMGTVDNIDDLMQIIRLKILVLTFRGFPSEVTEENFYAYLLGIVENSVKEYRKEYSRKRKREQYDTEESSVLDYLDTSESNTFESPEEATFQRERGYIEQKILYHYIHSLEENTIPPCRVMVYCYAILIPQLFKRSKNLNFLSKIETLSSGKTGITKSFYSKDDNRLEGEIARNSVVLINWALDVMYQKKVEELDREFVALYNEEPLVDEKFSWGAYYINSLKSDCAGKLMKEIVITEDFNKNTIKNWPVRVAKVLLEKTENKVLSDNSIGRCSMNLAEILYAG